MPTSRQSRPCPCEAAPGIIDLLDRMAAPFNRTPEGLLDFRRFGGTLFIASAFAGERLQRAIVVDAPLCTSGEVTSPKPS